MASTPTGSTHRRIGHKKSRNGCIRCKARHVKCDEQAPCRNCVRHDLECSLVTSSPAGTSAHHRTSLPTPSSRGPEHSASPASHHPSPSSQHRQPPKLPSAISRSSTLGGGNGYPDVLCSEPAGIYSPHWMQSVRLFHHFCRHTAYYMSSHSATTDLWLSRVPDVACSHEFLMHGLLACSALHFARTNPLQSQEYIILSTHYQTLALQSFTNRLSDINEDNVEAYFLLATFIFMLAIASISDPIARQNKTAGPKDLAQSFILLHGIKGILDIKAAEKLGQHDGPLAAMLHRKNTLVKPMSNRTSNFTRRLDRLMTLARELDTSIFFDVVNPQTACILALESLRSTYYGCMDTQNVATPAATNTPSAASPGSTPVAATGVGAGASGPAIGPQLPHTHHLHQFGGPGGRYDEARGINHHSYQSPATSTPRPEEDPELAEQGQRFTWLWPLTLSQVFIQLVANNNHMALIIVAHYAALARPYEGPFWVTNGWAASVLAIVENNLDPEKQRWIAWPKRCIVEELHVDELPDDDF